MSVTNLDVAALTRANRYLAGQIEGAEKASFEAELQRDPETVRELEATARFKVGLQRLHESGELAALLRPPPWYRQPLAYALAASLAVLVIGVLLFQSRGDRAGASLLAATASTLIDANGNALSLTDTVAVFRKRVDSYDAVIELPASPQAVPIRVLPESPSASGRYRLTVWELRDPAPARKVGALADLQPDEEGFVTAYADSSQLTAGRYRLTVGDETAPDAGSGGDAFLIRVVTAAAQ